MTRTIKRWDDDVLIWEGEAETVKDAIYAAIAAKVDLWRANLGDVDLRDADLRGANLGDVDLRGADLRGADLGGANNVRLPTGETWDDYLTHVVPALLTAAGQPLDSFKPHFDCHSWKNCPIAHAFSTHGLDGVPVLLRPRADQFIQLFDARQIPWSAIEKAIAASAPSGNTADFREKTLGPDGKG
jgi:hypothetical protein